ncbi:MAG TPA: SPOR domain-containing protein [Steroidobacteraceae bacterium]
MRAAFFLLLFANLVYLAWSQWIDVPQPATSNEVYAKLPRLKLVGEQPPAESPRPPSGSARKTALQPPAAQSAAARCLSVGPFDDEAGATRGASLLRDKGLAPRQRTVQGEVSKGFWVYIGNLKTDSDVSQVLRTLEQSHVDDAKVMPDTGPDTHRVSIGVFTDRDRADRRAQSIKKLGLEPAVAARKVPGTVFWMDVDVPAGTASPTSQDLAGDAAAAALIQVTACPSSPDGTAPLPAAPGAGSFRTKVATGASKVP